MERLGTALAKEREKQEEVVLSALSYVQMSVLSSVCFFILTDSFDLLFSDVLFSFVPVKSFAERLKKKYERKTSRSPMYTQDAEQLEEARC